MTMHLLHLYHQQDGRPCPMRLAQLADVLSALTGYRHTVLLVGPAAMGPVAGSVGLGDARLWVPPLGRVGLLGPGLGRWLKRHPVDAVVAWTTAMAGLAVEARDDVPVVVMDLEHCPVVSPDRLPADRQAARSSLRRDWSVGEEEMVVALVGRSVTELDAMLGGWAVGLVDHTRRSMRLLVGPGCRGLGRLERMLRAGGRSRRLLVDPRADQPWQVLAGADLALTVDSPANFGGVDLRWCRPPGRPATAGGLGLAWAMAAGLAVVAEQSAGAGAMLEDGRTGLVVPSGRPRRLAQALMHLADRADLRGRLGRAAAEWARGHLNPAVLAGAVGRRLAGATAGRSA